MADMTRRFLLLACACVAAYVVLHVLRSLSVEPEARGLWAGAFGYMVSEIVASKIGRRRRRS